MKLHILLFLGAFMTLMATRLFAYPFVRPEVAGWLALEASLIYMVFAYTTTVKQALAISAMTLLWGGAVYYLLDVRQDAIGIVVWMGLTGLAFMAMRRFRTS